uniref:WD repeat-containing protein on Y chromosome n=1 Tax=Poecilia latipinna TaxID=48699 RepID=A0A3B3U1Y3_9TELE
VTSVAYSPWSRYFLTGGMSGVLRVWFPHKTKSYERELLGHKETVSHVVYNSIEKMFVSISIDKQICFWTDGDWNLKQRIFPSGLIPTAPITSVCYNIHNNEFYVANSVIGKCFGRGTNVFHETLKSHCMPLCSMLYHGIYKQVISVCQKGIVTVWDILTGKAVMEFDITPSKHKIAGNTFMSFDEVNRKLITISCDRLIKHWNFNSGEQLEILEATLPNDVTSIVLMNDVMYISTKDSSKILQLNSNGKLMNEFDHFLLNNISSMDHHDDKLIVASSNGNILTWDLETLTVLYYINTTNNPKIQSLELYLRQQTLRHDLLIDATTGTLLTIGDLYITAWSTTINGGLISRFKAVIQDGAKITCVSLSESETILLTGDSYGVVCLYDIEDFGLQTKDNLEYETITSWKAGTSELISVACDPACEKIITAEVDYNVKLWSSTGTFVGIFGKDRWVNMVPKQVPAVEDIEIVGPESMPPQEEKIIDVLELWIFAACLPPSLYLFPV